MIKDHGWKIVADVKNQDAFKDIVNATKKEIFVICYVNVKIVIISKESKTSKGN